MHKSSTLFPFFIVDSFFYFPSLHRAYVEYIVIAIEHGKYRQHEDWTPLELKSSLMDFLSTKLFHFFNDAFMGFDEWKENTFSSSSLMACHNFCDFFLFMTRWCFFYFSLEISSSFGKLNESSFSREVCWIVILPLNRANKVCDFLSIFLINIQHRLIA